MFQILPPTVGGSGLKHIADQLAGEFDVILPPTVGGSGLKLSSSTMDRNNSLILPPTVGGSGLKHAPRAPSAMLDADSPADRRRERIETFMGDAGPTATLILPPTVGGSGLKP